MLQDSSSPWKTKQIGKLNTYFWPWYKGQFYSINLQNKISNIKVVFELKYILNIYCWPIVLQVIDNFVLFFILKL